MLLAFFPALTAVTNRELEVPINLTFFNLTHKYIESVYEEIFNLKMHGNWSFQEAYSLPIKIRRWFFDRLIRYFEEKNERQKKAAQKL